MHNSKSLAISSSTLAAILLASQAAGAAANNNHNDDRSSCNQLPSYSALKAALTGWNNTYSQSSNLACNSPKVCTAGVCQ